MTRVSQVCFNRPKLTLSMRVFGQVILCAHFGPRRHTYIYHVKSRLNTPVWGSLRSPNYIPPPLTVHFSMTRSVRYQPILHTFYTLHTDQVYCLSYRFLNNVVITNFIEMVEMVEILDGRLAERSVERVRYVINNLLHLVIVKYGDISLVLSISTRPRLVTKLSLLVKYLVILHADPCNKSYITRKMVPIKGRARSFLLFFRCFQKQNREEGETE